MNDRGTNAFTEGSLSPGLVRRSCPLCGHDAFCEVVSLREGEFTHTNTSYRLEHVAELELDPDQRYPIVECRHCSMVYSLYHLDDRRESIVYERIIDTAASRTKILAIRRRIADTEVWLGMLRRLQEGGCERLQDLRVADYGCGWGTLLQAMMGPEVRVFGFDVTPWKIAWAREHGVTIAGSERELAALGPFDMCVTTSVLEHVRQPREVVRFLASIMKPVGLAYITAIVPRACGRQDWNVIRDRLRRGEALHKEINPWEHLNYFTRETFNRMLGEAGFTPCEPGTANGPVPMEGYYRFEKRI